MEEINCGEYVRTDEEGIFQIKSINYGKRIVVVKTMRNIIYNFPIREFIKYNHSFDIIDLIEKHDYINKYIVEDVTACHIKLSGYGILNKKEASKSNFIETILTKEQYEENSYKVQINNEE